MNKTKGINKKNKRKNQNYKPNSTRNRKFKGGVNISKVNKKKRKHTKL